MTMVFVADIGPLLIKITDKCHVIEHHHFGGYWLWGEFFRARMTVLMPILRMRAESRAPEPLNAISTIAGFTGIGELKRVRAGGATIANMTSGVFAWRYTWSELQ